MPIPEPTLSYNVDSAPVIARGMVYNEEQLNEAISGPVRDLLLDTSGTAEIGEMMISLASTEFDQQQIAKLLQLEPEPKVWQVGEALAEVYVSDTDTCIFPWPTSRDLKNPRASPTGADLTGFQKTEDETNPFRFAFGEVKTSSDKNYPPNVMYGQAGLKNQIEEIKNSFHTKKHLILYLGHRAKNASWQHMFESATKRYLSSRCTDIAIFGVLIRDVLPDKSDLSKRAISLATDCPSATSIALYALYIPLNTISLLQSKVQQVLQRGEL